MRSLFIASLMAVAARASNQGESGLAVGTGIEMYHFAVAVALCCPQGVRCGTEADVVSAIEALNAEFEPLRVDFELARLHKFSDVDCLHTKVNEQQAAEILARVHVGGSSTLNVLYLPTALEIYLSGGYAINPPEDPQLRIDQNLEKMDGVRISMNNLYDWKHKEHGKIDPNPHLLPHEVGHWLGLGHDKFTIANLMHPSVGPTYMVDYCFRSDQASQLRTMARRRLAEEVVAIMVQGVMEKGDEKAEDEESQLVTAEEPSLAFPHSADPPRRL
ncbi:hypothetical protein DCS_02202 [Drechmeria coniospora]|uniref:Peptidase M43 pregnancy-associated plasma-A domain-containing protein n=1 Tax=Drechmeria coniospora TaxID=98403 RepID=A0A151GVG2_DRECN|nr:hypothetical protein DCS_02202 [Drechmeria coniospora]KYK61061.1 hypothetical protein DCS_02202 [Drechmeria coniospora]